MKVELRQWQRRGREATINQLLRRLNVLGLGNSVEYRGTSKKEECRKTSKFLAG